MWNPLSNILQGSLNAQLGETVTFCKRVSVKFYFLSVCSPSLQVTPLPRETHPGTDPHLSRLIFTTSPNLWSHLSKSEFFRPGDWPGPCVPIHETNSSRGSISSISNILQSSKTFIFKAAALTRWSWRHIPREATQANFPLQPRPTLCLYSTHPSISDTGFPFLYFP